MKRFSFVEEGETEQSDMANLLMLLAHGGEGEINSQVFECKTCSRQFSSFQALGGHCASHKRPRLLEDSGGKAKLGVLTKPRTHECSICGREYTVGQALGGHMRRHRAEGIHHGLRKGEKRLTEKKRVPWLDLNLPPVEDGMVTAKTYTRGISTS